MNVVVTLWWGRAWQQRPTGPTAPATKGSDLVTLPIPPAELARRLSRGLGPRRDGLELTVTSADLTPVHDNRAQLRLLVTATTHADRRGQHWQVDIPIDTEDLDPQLLGTPALIITLRANLEEWWDVRAVEPDFAAWGHRLD